MADSHLKMSALFFFFDVAQINIVFDIIVGNKCVCLKSIARVSQRSCVRIHD